MSDGLIILTERDLLDLKAGEILEKGTVDGGTTVNVRLSVPTGVPHSRVMERARKLGFRKPARVVEVEAAGVEDDAEEEDLDPNFEPSQEDQSQDQGDRADLRQTLSDNALHDMQAEVFGRDNGNPQDRVPSW